MKIGGLESTMIQGQMMFNSPLPSDNTNFQMILGSALANNGQLPAETNSVQEVDPLMNLIEILLGDPETEETEFYQDIQTISEEIDPSWDETIHEILDWIENNVAPNQMPESIKQDEPIPGEFLAAAVVLFQVINGLNDETLKSMPFNQISSYIKSVKEFLFKSKDNIVNLSEMQQFEEVEVSMEHLLRRLQEMTRDTKYQNIRNSLDNAFFRGSETNDFRSLSNSSNLLQSLLGKSSKHDQFLNKQMIVNDHISDSNPVVRTESFHLIVSESANEETVMRGMIKEFSNILARSSLTQGLNTTKLLIRLHPEELGSLRVELLQKDGQLTARILASTHKAKEMLDFQLNSLRQAFAQQNISVDRIEVTYSQGDLQRYTNQDSRSSSQQHHEQNPDQGQSQNETNDNFKEALSNILFETEV
ncbi:flagellar hook-length control protein FliK [Bacillus sp. FJAT-49711]|uniref:flagellar hook-length control protein FliK n=1 Tax=Bacillus sp. FJAT-49711 TaxID=2833585 RepID=UPI001BC99D1C|nr:flagellar hook-length control protein FliK [Bacillus sp. FJAT-49711]MBS4217748.1 flagellar hook-length control protein FliK [Bacillus sp. FJAT-49711]